MIKLRLVLIILSLCFLTNGFNITTTETSIWNDDVTKCGKTCALCGQNSLSCTFIAENCEILCICKEGFNGSKCEYLIHAISKDSLWSTIFNQVNIYDTNEVFQKMIFLLNNFKLSINEIDIYNTYLILDKLNSCNQTFTVETIELLFNYIDLLISCNNFNNNNASIFFNANQLYNMSSIKVLNLLDAITARYITSNSSNNFLFKKLEKFQVMVSNFNTFGSTMNSTKLVKGTNNEFEIEMDSISLNETILRSVFKNDTLKIILKIFYTLQANQNQTLTLESNETSFSLKSNLFFDINHPAAQVESNESYIISSTILSAILIHKSISVHNLTDDKHSKFVRIQFTVKSKSNGFERNLKCVYWNDNELGWSTNGCFTSRTESVFIINKKFYRKVCYCNHLTNFALLFDPNPYSSLKSEEIDDIIFNYLLSLISYIGIIVSLICYFIMIVTRLFAIKFQINDSFYQQCSLKFLYQVVTQGSSQSSTSSNQQLNKQPKKRGDYILRCLYLANISFLFLANIFFVLLTFIKRSTSFNLCIAVGLSLQYTLLTSFCFSLGIAYQHFSKLVLVFSTNYNKKNFVIKWFLMSITAPIPFVFLTYFYDLKDTRDFNYDFCWLTQPYLYYFFIIPILCLLFSSLVF